MWESILAERVPMTKTTASRPRYHPINIVNNLAFKSVEIVSISKADGRLHNPHPRILPTLSTLSLFFSPDSHSSSLTDAKQAIF